MFDILTTIRSSQSAYPERLVTRNSWLDRTGSHFVAPFSRWQRIRRARSKRFVEAVGLFSTWAADLSRVQLLEAATDLRQELRRYGFKDAILARSFALTREAASRALGQRHYDVQLIGARVLLNGLVAEMATGEGKTLTATLAASAAALAGIPVHIITVNDYLASRDAEWMTPVYASLGLTVGTIIHGLSPDQRRAAYGADITYCTNKEIAFDYLKDRITLGREAGRIQLQVERLYERRPRLDQLLLRGLFFGIVDEADSVLVDEARTPLIISGPRSNESSEAGLYKTALSIAEQMEAGRDFVIEERHRMIRMLPAGIERVARMAEPLGGVWVRRHWREDLVRQALAAHHLFAPDKHYLIKDRKVQIIDEYTGRIMADRSWEHGLHQMIEVKEGCDLTQRIDNLARMSYQRFFRRYLLLAGMTGTGREVTGELWSVYRLATVSVPTNRPSKRQRWPDRICDTLNEKWHAVVARIDEIHKTGRPILVGTRSVAASEHLSRLLTERGLSHQLLNARQDFDEARIVAEAGARGRITVATNMAGRGTDIKLAPGVAELGGLHVIATEFHEASRIDRQLFGRSGRQGDPGSCEAIVSLQDELAEMYLHRLLRRLVPVVAHRALSGYTRAIVLKIAQRSAERLHFHMRRDLLEMDEQLDSTLAFSGKAE
jgi:preprotein translocase subunit SecA